MQSLQWLCANTLLYIECRKPLHPLLAERGGGWGEEYELHIVQHTLCHTFVCDVHVYIGLMMGVYAL